MYQLRLIFGIVAVLNFAAAKTEFQDDWYRYEKATKTFAAQSYNGQKRSGSATNSHSCDTIRNSVPASLTFITRWRFYQKYTEAYGIPIVSSARVSDKALKRACHIARFLFADRYDLRNGFYQNQGRYAVIAIAEQTTTIPEFSHLPAWWNQRARGLGGVLGRAVSCGGEENVLCLRQDRYYGDDIFFHEAAHGVAEVGLAGGLPHLYSRLKGLYNSARRAGRWARTYAMTDSREYFAEALQSYHNNHIEGPNPSNGVHGHINTRSELKAYDPNMYNFLKELYPCGNIYFWCKDSAAGPNLRMNCDGTGPVITQKPTLTDAPVTNKPGVSTTDPIMPPIPTTTVAPPTVVPPTNCINKNQYCVAWAKYGYCKTNPYTQQNCKLACGTC